MVTTRSKSPRKSDGASDGALRQRITGSPAKETLSDQFDQAVAKGQADGELNPATEHREFGGAIGAAILTIGIPFFALGVEGFLCTSQGCPPSLKFIRSQGLDQLTRWKTYQPLLDARSLLAYMHWYAFCVLAYFMIPGPQVQGTKLRTGRKLAYKMNALQTLLLALALTAVVIQRYGPRKMVFIYDHLAGLCTGSLLVSTVIAIYCHVMSYSKGRLLAEGGNTGNHIYDFFIGRELNPRIGTFDLKAFNELRPGIIGWLLIDIACACKQYVSFKTVDASMILVCLFHGMYAFDALYNESAILTTMDITTDGFGFMLAAGDLSVVPFIYSLQAQFLAVHPVKLGISGVAGVLAIQAFGYYIFRGANGEKNDFRSGKNPKDLKFMETAAGSKLLISGWWGRARHINYLGDWIMSWAWCLPCGFSSPIPYFYVLYFAILLVHRERRDDEKCRKKYGQDWEKYCELVPSRIIPYVY